MKSIALKLARKSLLFISIFYSFSSFAVTNVYMGIIGQTQTDIHGDVTDAVYLDTFKITEMHHLIRKPGNLSKTEHQPLIVTTLLGKSITKLLRALDTNEQLTVTFSFTQSMFNHYTMILNNATIIAMEPIMPDTTVTENLGKRIQIRLRFNYSSIEYIYNEQDPGNPGIPSNTENVILLNPK